MVVTLNDNLSCFNKMCKFFQLFKNIGNINFVLKYADMNSFLFLNVVHYFSSDLIKSKTEIAMAAWVKCFHYVFS